MAQEPFDPYRKWLGIPPRDQPPNHYRLLGIEVFESDPDVVSNAADGRMGQIRTFQTGQHSQWSQRLLNEVAAARVCLLNEAKKAAYDEALRRELGAEDESPVLIRQGDGPPMLPTDDSSRLLGPLKVVPSAADSGPGTRFNLPVLAAVVAVVAVLIGLAVRFLPSGGSDIDTSPGSDSNTELASRDNTAHHDPTVPPRETAPNGHGPQEIPDRVDDGESEGPPSVPADNGVSEPALADIDQIEKVPQGPVNEPDQPPTDNRMTNGLAPDSPSSEPLPLPVAPPPSEPDRHGLVDLLKPPSRSIPDESDQENAGRRIREIFQEDFDALDAPADKVALAGKLLRQGLDTDDDRVARYVLLKMAADLATSVSDPQEAFLAIDAIKQHYDADSLAMKADVLTEIVKQHQSGETGTHLAQAAALLAEEAVARDNYVMADRLLNLGGVFARKAANKIMGSELSVRAREVSRAAREYASIEKALGVLADNPLDARANGEVGRWHCFQKNDWPQGLTYLAKAENAPLAELARRDLAALEKLLSLDQQRELGNDWWDLSEDTRGPAKAAYICRAVHWYHKALIGITGLDKLAVEKRIETASRDRDTVNSPTWGFVEKGNLALLSNGTSVIGVTRDAPQLLAGGPSGRRGTETYARSKCPCKWVFVFAKPYRLTEIRFKLWDVQPSSFRYAIGTSPDGKDFVPLADRSQGIWSSWQQFRFPSRLVKSVTIFGAYSSINNEFMAREFQAYCIPPETPPGTVPR